MRQDPLHEMRKRLLRTVSGKSISEYVNRVGSRYQKSYEAVCERLCSPEMIIAVIGRQGVGKSSLLNALLFNRRHLPVDVTTTTNVPCFVRCADESGERVVVYFKDERRQPKVGLLSSEFLRSHLDEQQNQNNSLGVRHVEVFAKTDLVADGVRLVDTPGTDAFGHQEHTEVTHDLLPRLCAAIFLLSTTPTLTQSEASLLEAAWQYQSAFVFVQNVWDSDVENGTVEEACEDNLRKLRNIATEKGTPPESIRFFPVNVYQALEGACNDEPHRVQQSGILALRETLQSMLGQGTPLMQLTVDAGQLSDCLKAATESTDLELESLKQRDDQQREELDRKLDELESRIRDYRKEWKKQLDSFFVKRDSVIRRYVDDLEERKVRVRNELACAVEEGQMDQENLSKAFESAIQGNFSGAAAKLQSEYEKEVATLVDSVGEQLRSIWAVASVVFPSRSDLEIGEGIGKLGRAGSWTALLGMGGIAAHAALAAGTAVATKAGLAAAVTTGLAAAGSAVPVIGWLAAAGALAGAELLRRHAKHKRVAEMKKAFEESIAKSFKEFRESAENSINDHSEKVKDFLDEKLKRSEELIRSKIKVLRQDYNLSAQEREANRVELAKQLGELQAAQRDVQAIIEELTVQANARPLHSAAVGGPTNGESATPAVQKPLPPEFVNDAYRP